MPTAAEIWKPNVTVASIIERDGKFLLVEEETQRGAVYNQPAGHLEFNESLVTAVVRETLEETAYHFMPRALLGVYHYYYGPGDTTYLRFAFVGDTTAHDPQRELDAGIIRAVWLTADEIRSNRAILRTPLVETCVDDYLAGKRYPLELLNHCGGVA
jgi:ADP-ribose pyrophosphatase YjhB (NUDIX family)